MLRILFGRHKIFLTLVHELSKLLDFRLLPFHFLLHLGRLRLLLHQLLSDLVGGPHLLQHGSLVACLNGLRRQVHLQVVRMRVTGIRCLTGGALALLLLFLRLGLLFFL